jgi:carbamoyl-phosphate synthase small subunit
VIAALVLEDGTVFSGESVGAEGVAFGEAVFTTSMSGYQEVATDPSFAGQIVCFTAPMVGNYGIDDARSESSRVHAKAIVMREARGPEWTDWLHANGIVALTGVDTRSLVLHLRELGAMRAAAVTGDIVAEEVVTSVLAQPAMAGAALVAGVSTPERFTFAPEGEVRVAVVDYGCKRSILRRLAANGAAVDVFPHDVDADSIAGYDGVLLSPGPGDPAPLVDEANALQGLLGRTPVLGVCLSCSRSQRDVRRSSCHSATAARTILWSTTARAASSSPHRTTGLPWPPATSRRSRTPRSTTARSKVSLTPSCARARLSSIRRRRRARTTLRRSSPAGSTL